MELNISAPDALALTVVSMICWGSWANTYKLAGAVRFELFYWDYAFGLAATALILAVAIGTGGHGAGSVASDLLNATPDALFEAAAAGTVFNLANLLLVAAIAIAGLAVAFPVAIGTALIAGTAMTFFVDRKGAPLAMFIGVALAAVAVCCCAVAYRHQSTEFKVTRKGVVICVVSGLLMASWAPLAAASMQRSAGHLAPLSCLLVFALAVLVSTVPFNLYLMRRPLLGAPVSLRGYTSGGVRWHVLGIVGGAVWTIGTASNLIAGKAVGFAISYAIGQSAPLVASLWGIFAWKEFAGANSTVVRSLTAMFIFYVAAIAVLSRAF